MGKLGFFALDVAEPEPVAETSPRARGSNSNTIRTNRVSTVYYVACNMRTPARSAPPPEKREPAGGARLDADTKP
eukprot:1163171-Prorocentrum_minimum.AAC.1